MGQRWAGYLIPGLQLSCSGKQISLEMSNSSMRWVFGLGDCKGPFSYGIPWFYGYKLFSRKKLTCQVIFAPIYTESLDLTEVPVGLPTYRKKKKKQVLQEQGLDCFMEKLICSTRNWKRNLEGLCVWSSPSRACLFFSSLMLAVKFIRYFLLESLRILSVASGFPADEFWEMEGERAIVT